MRSIQTARVAWLSLAASLAAQSAPTPSTNVIVEWGQQSTRLGRAAVASALDTGRLETVFQGSRARVLMHLAQHDALNAIAPRFECYVAPCGSAPQADAAAALAQASYEVLVSQFPQARDELRALLATHLQGTPSSAARSAGILAGRRAAGTVVRERRRDGWYGGGTHVFSGIPGAYQTTGPRTGYVLHPGLRFARPFALRSPDQFRPRRPPALTSAEYARAFEEVKRLGRADSEARTAEQTAYAVWWMDFAEFSIFEAAEQLILERRQSAHDATRLLAAMSLALADTYIAVWDSKYEYAHWRPQTAIHAAQEDGNEATLADAGWQPLRPVPPMPDYVSAHAAACSSTLAILRMTFGDRVTFTMRSQTAPPGMPTRTFARFSEAAVECADSRVQLGFHFRYATDEGFALGERVARHVNGSLLR